MPRPRDKQIERTNNRLESHRPVSSQVIHRPPLAIRRPVILVAIKPVQAHPPPTVPQVIPAYVLGHQDAQMHNTLDKVGIFPG